VKGRCPSP